MHIMKNDSLLSQTISYLRFPLIVGVVFIHSNILVLNVQGTILRYDSWPVVAFVINLFSSVFAGICVPLFFFISGFLFFYNSNFTKEVYINKIKTRIGTLLVPYIIWNFVAFIILLIQVHPKVVRFFPLLKDYRVDIFSFLSSFWVTNLPISMSGPANPINTPLWFIRDLMVLVIASPVIWWLIKQLKFGIIVLLGLIWFFSLGERIGFPGLCHQSLFFFPLGAYVGINKVDFVNFILKKSVCSYVPLLYIVMSLADSLLQIEAYNYVIHNLGIIIGMLSAVYLTASLLLRGKIHINVNLIGASFFIFVLHNLFLGKITKLVVMCFQPDSPFLVLFIYFFMPIFTIVICIIAYLFIRKHFPIFCSIIVGNR